MPTIHQHIARTSEDYSTLFRKLLEPLQQRFGIHYFCYQKVTSQYEWLIAGSNPEWLHYSAEQQFYRCDPSLTNLAQNNRGAMLPETHLNKLFQNTFLKAAENQFDLYYTLAIIEPSDTGCEYFFFQHLKSICMFIILICNKLTA